MTGEPWRLPDSSGRNEFRAEVIPVISRDGVPIFKISFSLLGKFWDRLEEPGKLVDDVSLAVSQFLVERDSLIGLLEALDEWMERRMVFSCRLSAHRDDQSLTFEVGPSDLRISSEEHPVCLITYRGSAILALQFAMVADQSCIRIFRDGLFSILEDYGDRH
jgi:hypothetical protein